MDILVIAQLITGIATLMVASVLIWQMIIQKKTLDLAHKDADSSLSFDAVEHRANLNMWFTDKIDQKFLDNANKGLNNLSDVEKEILTIWLRSSFVILITEYRLGRMNRNREYYKGNIVRLLRFKACQELAKEMGFNIPNNIVMKGLTKIMIEAYEEVVGEKIGV